MESDVASANPYFVGLVALCFAVSGFGMLVGAVRALRWQDTIMAKFAFAIALLSFVGLAWQLLSLHSLLNKPPIQRISAEEPTHSGPSQTQINETAPEPFLVKADNKGKEALVKVWWQGDGGFIRTLPKSYRGWATAGGVVSIFVVWCLITGACMAVFEQLLFVDTEAFIIVVLCWIIAIALYVFLWGYACWWGWILLGIGLGKLSSMTIQVAKQ